MKSLASSSKNLVQTVCDTYSSVVFFSTIHLVSLFVPQKVLLLEKSPTALLIVCHLCHLSLEESLSASLHMLEGQLFDLSPLLRFHGDQVLLV